MPLNVSGLIFIRAHVQIHVKHLLVNTCDAQNSPFYVMCVTHNFIYIASDDMISYHNDSSLFIEAYMLSH